MRFLWVMPAACALAAGLNASAQTQTPVPAQHETIEVTATKVAEDVYVVPASITVVDGDELRARNARDLQSALAFVGGVSIAPGADAGPAGSVPEIWGLREFDAYLLVVDGVPWGGAFNPDTPSLDLGDVDRIEILRGAAPVMYGATSFVGVIHVIHREPGSPAAGRVTLGNHSSGGASVSFPLSQSIALRQSLNVNYDKQGYRDPGTSWNRAHALYRLASTVGGGTLRFDADVNLLNQDPASPRLRTGTFFPPVTPIDANYNPINGKIDDRRYYGVIGYDTHAAGMPWTTTLALTRSNVDSVRGFLTDITAADLNATGFTQSRTITDLYFDSHVTKQFSPMLRVVGGLDYLYGRGVANSGLFDYFVPLSGASRPSSPTPDERTSLTDRRNFSGLYASAEWTASPRLRIDAGARLNHTTEATRGEDQDGINTDSRTFTRLSGSIGATYRVWSHGRDEVALYGDYRNTFKPAAIDFGPDAESDILNPETAHSYEVGAKGRSFDSRLTWDASVFQMDFSNLVVATIVNGLPATENAGAERFRGGELDADYAFTGALHGKLGYSYHDSRYTDFAKDFDGVVTQLAGDRLEMVPFHLVNAGIVFTRPNGFNANVLANYVGDRFLNQRNTAVAKAYTMWSAGAGMRLARGEVRVDGRNLNDVRPPVSESELGDSQYYILPARTWEVSYRMTF